MEKTLPFIPWWRIQYSQADIDSVTRAIQAEHISLGPVTAEFEANLAEKLSIPYVVTTTSGSMAILMALMALGIGEGDEVIIPNRTWIAAAHATRMTGAKVVLTDVLGHIPIIDPSQIEANITPKTKAIIPTALSGRAVNIEIINSIAKRYGLYVIEDAAQAMFSYEKNKFAGTRSDLGCFSLSVAKLIPAGQGGCVVTHNQDLYKKLRRIRTHGVDDLLACQYQQFGFNCRFTDLQASIALSQLQVVENKIGSLNNIYKRYEKGLSNCNHIQIIPIDLNNKELPLYIEVVCPDRENLVAYLETKNIQVKMFYPNLNRANYLNCHGEFPRSERFESQGLTLPCGPDQPIENVDLVLEALIDYENNIRVLPTINEIKQANINS